MVEDNWRVGYKKFYSGPRDLVAQPLSRIKKKKTENGSTANKSFGLHIIYSLFVLHRLECL